MDKVGELTDRKRVMVFADDDNAIDCKSHFEFITHKIDLNAADFIHAVEDAIQMKLKATENQIDSSENSIPDEIPSEPEPEVEEEIKMEEQTQPVEMELDPEDEQEIDLEALCNDIREKYSAVSDDIKKQVRAVLEANNTKRLSANLGEDVLRQIADIVGL